jgi:glutaredoxin 3
MIVYVKPGCWWCVEALDWMRERGLAHKVVDVFAEPGAYDHMRAISGQGKAPTLEMPDGAVLADFDVGQLERFLKERGTL